MTYHPHSFERKQRRPEEQRISIQRPEERYLLDARHVLEEVVGQDAERDERYDVG